MDLHELLLKLFRAPDYVPMRRDEVFTVLRLRPKDSKKANRLIDQMLERGEIARLKKDKLCIPDDADLISGRILFRPNGAATLMPEPSEAKPKPTNSGGYPVAPEDTGVAMHGDQVLARVIRASQRPFRKLHPKRRTQPSEEEPKVRVIRILKRARDTIPGTLEKGRHAYYVIPDDPRIPQDLLVPEPANCGLQPIPKVGDKVVVQLGEWKQRHLNPEGEIIKVLGRTHAPDAEFKAILHKYNLNPQFPAAVEKQTEQIPDHVRPQDMEGRQDCRELFTFTIDPDDAKDFDDAISVEHLEEGKTRIGVHIADVSAYVKPGTALDIEAQERGNSTYLVGTVIPMLPHALSNGLCSLVEAQDRLTKTCFITFSTHAEIIAVDFANTVICSNKRLTYKQAYAFMMEDELEVIRKTPLPPKHQTGSTGRALEEVSEEEMRRLQQSIRKSWEIASQLRRNRFRRGSLDLDMTEVKIYVDQEGYADRIEKQFNDESHQLIEEFMLSANEQVARIMKRKNFPCVYRVHDEPEDEKLQELRETMITFGLTCGNLGKPREMGSLLRKLKQHPQGYTLKVHVLRSLKQAQYRASADGHYGLAKPDYTHFTSPIRRYSDLIVHRVLDSYLHKQGADSALDQPDIRYSQGKLQSLGDHLSVTERNSVDAERESVKTKLLEFYERELQKPQKQSFKAIITDVKNHGLFIELTDSLAFGMVHISTLDDDFYHPSHDGTALVGRRHKKAYTLGQYIMVQVERVDRFKRQIDFRVTVNKDQAERCPAEEIERRSKGRQASAKRIAAGHTKQSSVAPLVRPRGAGGPKRQTKTNARPFKRRKHR